jgi:hypothetical protein
MVLITSKRTSVFSVPESASFDEIDDAQALANSLIRETNPHHQERKQSEMKIEFQAELCHLSDDCLKILNEWAIRSRLENALVPFHNLIGFATLAKQNYFVKCPLFYSLMFQLYACDQKDTLLFMINNCEYLPSQLDVYAAVYFRATNCLEFIVQLIEIDEIPNLTFPKDYQNFIGNMYFGFGSPHSHRNIMGFTKMVASLYERSQTKIF